MVYAVLALAVGVVVLAATAWLVAAFRFSGEDLSEFDSPRPASTGKRTTESDEHQAAAKEIADALAAPPPAKGKKLLELMRQQLDQRCESAEILSEVRIADAGGVAAEWVIAPTATPERRLLYIHGGGYVMGSSKSHRPMASRLSEVSNSAVLSIDYRLMPEHTRMEGIEDCRTGYAWILANGPDGPSSIETLIVAGDSSGGNLALSTIAWARDTGQRSAKAVVVLCPHTDATFSSPSVMRNLDTDVMQGKSMGPVVKAPKVFTFWITYLMHRINPSNQMVSPVRGDLSNLPPTLLQASEAEMFLDDAVRYANKANACGSTAVVQTWPYVMHVWHAFPVPEADEAFAEIGSFLAIHAPNG